MSARGDTTAGGRGRALTGASELLALGISHKTAPVALRERLAFSESQSCDFARQLGETPEVSEAVVISTCNRTEVYLVASDPVRAETEALGRLAQRAGIRPTELAQQIYSPRNCDAARQLYRVTAGLESMILGEAEIQGQVKRAYESALAAGVTGPLLNRLFAAALTTGKRVRAETGIAASRVSVPSVAVDLAQDVLGSLADRHVVILGAGETSELTAQALAHQGAGTIFVANRHADRALSLAQRFGGSVVGLDGLPDQLLRADIVVCSTSSPHPIVGAEELELVMVERRERARGAEPGRRGRGEHERGGRKGTPHDGAPAPPASGRDLLLIDIAVPRDVEAACGDVEGVTLYDIDDLQAVVERNLGARAEILPRAEEIVEEEIHRFARWLGQAETLPTVAALREHADALVEQILKENAGRWESASERDLMRVEAIARAVVARLLHEPTIRLRSLSRERARAGAPAREGSHAGGHAILALVRELFGLDDEPREARGQAPSERTREARGQASGLTGGQAQADDSGELAEVRSIGSARKG
jgi:glutamyl-tRNA reductase